MRLTVAIVIPVYKQYNELEESERISLMQCFKVLHEYEIFIVTHRGIDESKYRQLSNIKTVYFDKAYFESIEGYNKLLLTYRFYKSFKAFKYILISQLDVFIFSDQLDYFSKLGYDYIGAPWFEGYSHATPQSRIIGVGNGGFSLRKVKSFLSVLSITNVFQKPYFRLTRLIEVLKQPKSFIRILKYRLNAHTDLTIPVFPWQYYNNEDVYWSLNVKQFFPWFKVGKEKDAISFSFEVNPRILYELNDNKLPMATHAWEKYDLIFWKPFIESHGYDLESLLNQEVH